MVNRLFRTVLGALVMSGIVGCMSGGNDLQRVAYDTYRRTANLDKSLQSSVTQLNETSATLLARVEENDTQLQNVQGVLEQNQLKLGSLEKKLDSLTNLIYREQGRTLLPGSAAMPAPPVPPGPPGPGMENPGNFGPATAPGTAPAAPPDFGGGNSSMVAPAAPGTAPAIPPVQPLPTAQPAGPADQMPPAETPLESVAVGPQATPPVEAPPSEEDAQSAYQAAQKKYVRQDYQGALDLYAAYLQKYPLAPDAQDAQFWRAKSFQALGQYEQAIAEYKKLRDQYPVGQGENAAKTKVPSSMHQQAVCHARLGQTERALELFKQVIRDYPNSAAAVQATEDLQHIQ